MCRSGNRELQGDVLSCAGLTLDFPKPEYRRLRSATDAIALPESKPRRVH